MDKIEITFQDKKYTLQYNRYSIVKMEKEGFDVSKADKQPLSTLIELSRGAFIMHHPELKQEDIDLIIDEIPNKMEFVSALAEMYKNAIEAVVGNNKKVGNATWGRA